jgi:hypothetical protein
LATKLGFAEHAVCGAWLRLPPHRSRNANFSQRKTRRRRHFGWASPSCLSLPGATLGQRELAILDRTCIAERSATVRRGSDHLEPDVGQTRTPSAEATFPPRLGLAHGRKYPELPRHRKLRRREKEGSPWVTFLRGG